MYEDDIVYIAGFGNCLVSIDHDGVMFNSVEHKFVIEDIEIVVGNINTHPELEEK